MSFIHSKLDKANQDQAVLFLSEMQVGVGFLGGRYFFHKDKPQEKLAFKEITEIFLKRCETKTLEPSPVIISQLTSLNSAGNALLNKNQGIAGRILRFFHAISQAFGNRFKKINHQLNIQRIAAFIPKVAPLTKIIPAIQRSVKLLDLSQEKNPLEASVPEPILVKPKDVKAELTAIQPSLDTTKVDPAIDTTKGVLLTDLRRAEIGVEESPIIPPQPDPKDEVPVSLPTTAKTPVDTAIKIDSLQSSIIASEEIQANTASSILPSDKAPNLEEEAPKSIPEPVYDLSQYQRELADSYWWLGGCHLTSPSVPLLNAKKEFETLATESYSRAVGEQERFNQLIRLLGESGLNFDSMSTVVRLHLKIDNQSLLEPEKCISEILSQAKRSHIEQRERTKLELKLIAYYILSEILDKELGANQKIVSIRDFVAKFQKENSWIELQGVIKEVALICNSAQAKILLDCLITWDQYVTSRAKSSKPYSVDIANLIDYFLHGVFSENAYAEDGKRESIFEQMCQSVDSNKHLLLFFKSMRRNTDPFARQFSRNRQLSERMQKFIVSLILQRQSSIEAHLDHLYKLNLGWGDKYDIKNMRRTVLECLTDNPIPSLSLSLESEVFNKIFPVEVSEPSDNRNLANPQEVHYKDLFLLRMLNRLRLESGKITVITKIVDDALIKAGIPSVLVSMMVEYSEEISQARSAIILNRVKIHYERDLKNDSNLFNEIKALFNTKAA